MLEAMRDRPIHQTAAGVAQQLMVLMTLVGALLFVAVVAVMRRKVGARSDRCGGPPRW